jgi:hypothetical protein
MKQAAQKILKAKGRDQVVEGLLTAINETIIVL